MSIDANRYSFADIQVSVNGTPISSGESKTISYDSGQPEPSFSITGSFESDSDEFKKLSKWFEPRLASKYWQKRFVYQRRHFIKRVQRYGYVEYRFSRFLLNRCHVSW